MKRIFAAILSAILILVLCTACGASAEAPYPDGPITLIVNYSAGGGTDLAARALCDAASQLLGQPITVTNVTGGSGTVGITEMSNAEADGYTIGVATLAPLAIVPWQMDVTYTPDSFEYLCTYGQYGYGLVVSADSPYQTVDDLLAAAKADGSMNYGATGYPQPFAMEELGAAADVTFQYVTYSSTTDLITDVLGGFVPCALCDQASFTAYVEDGSMRLLASATDKRWDCAPDVETLQEMGYDISLLSYMGICAPAGIPEEALTALRDAFAQASEDATYQEILENSNLVFTYMSGEDYETLVRDKYATYEALFADMD